MIRPSALRARLQPTRPGCQLAIALCLAGTCGALSSVAVSAPSAAVPMAQISLRKGMHLQQALEAVSDATGLPCLAQPLETDRELSSDLAGPGPQVLTQLAGELDLQIACHPDCITFSRRYSRPVEKPDLPEAELAGVLTALHSIIRSQCPPPVTGSGDSDYGSCADSRTPEQVRHSQEGGFSL